MLTHLALRRAAIERLCPHSAGPNGPWPTVADDRVFDTLLTPPNGLKHDEARPTVVIYAEDVQAEAGSRTNGVPHQAQLALVVEVSAVVVRSTQGGIELGSPASDPVLEASLDTLATQVYHLLVEEPGHAFRVGRRKTEKFTSVAYRDAEGGQRMAVRALTLWCDLPTDPLAHAKAVHDALPTASEGRALLATAIEAVEITRAFYRPPEAPFAGSTFTVAPATGLTAP